LVEVSVSSRSISRNPTPGVIVIFHAFFILGLQGCATRETVNSEPVNGCDAASVIDYTGDAEVEIRFGEDLGYEYVPRCIRVSVGTRIRFRGDLKSHPVAPGRVVDGSYTFEDTSPIQPTKNGDEATFVFSRPGAFGYWCDVHAVSGMLGAVFVE
jgi:plastocyanin